MIMCDLHSTTAFHQANQRLLMTKTGLTYKLSLRSTQHLSAYDIWPLRTKVTQLLRSQYKN